MALTENVILGSGVLYISTYTDAIPADEAFEVDANKLGDIKGGCSIAYKPKSYEVKNDAGQIVSRYILEREITMKSGVLKWSVDTLKKLMGEGTLSDDTVEHIKTLTIGSGIQGLTAYAIRFVHTDASGKKLRVTICGTNEAGISLAFQPDKETVVDAEFKALPMPDGNMLIISQEYSA